MLHFFITWVEERKSAGEILHDETQLFTHFLVRGVKYPSTRSTYREKPEQSKKESHRAATVQAAGPFCMDAGNIKIAKNGAWDLQCTFLLLVRWGKAPRMLCALRSCLVRIPTIGEI